MGLTIEELIKLTFLYSMSILLTTGKLPKNCRSYSQTLHCNPVVPTHLPVSACDFKNIHKFKLLNTTNNAWILETLPSGLFDGTNVTEVMFDSVGLRFLYSEVFRPIKGSLKKISLNWNLIENFPNSAFAGLSQLQTVTMRFQQTGIRKCSFHSDLGLKSLTKIDLSGNKMSSVEFHNFGNENPFSLILDTNDLVSLNLTALYHIEFLSASNNRLRNIVEGSFNNVKNTFKHMNLSENSLTEQIWGALAGVDSLETLVLAGNIISIVSPLVIGDQINLTYLDLSRNSIQSLEDVSLRSGKLAYLFLNENQIQKLPNEFLSLKDTFESPWAGILDLSSNCLQDTLSLPIPKCEKHCHIQLGDNRLENLSLELSLNTELELFNISGNRFKYLPSNLPSAKYYIISRNPLHTRNVLTEMHRKFKNASSLEIENSGLFCENKNYENEDNQVYEFEKLELLNLRNNCVPTNFLCEVNIKRSFRKTKILIDGNVVQDLKENCSQLLSNIAIYSINNMKTGGVNVMHAVLHPNSTSTLQSPVVSSLHLSGNNIRHLPSPLSLTFKHQALNGYVSAVNLDLSDNNLYNISNLRLTIDFEDTIFLRIDRAQIFLNFAKNRISKIKSLDVMLSQSRRFPLHPHSQYSITYNFSRNYINLDGDINLLFSNNYHRLYRYLRFKLLVDLSFNFLKNIDLHKIFKNSSPYTGGYVYMNISNNNLAVLPNCELLNRFSVVYLDVSHNNITQIRTGFSVIDMYLGYNRIVYVPGGIGSGKLQTLYLDHNLITEIDRYAFRDSQFLRTLNLNTNLLIDLPMAFIHLKRLRYLDISMNCISSLKNIYILKTLIYLETLILARNDFVVVPDDRLKVLNTPKINCDCSLLFLRNYTLRVSGRCSSPPEVRGYHVSCFPIYACPQSDPLYIHSNIIAKCHNDNFKDFKLAYGIVASSPVIIYRRYGAVKNTDLQLQLFSNNQSVEIQTLPFEESRYTFISTKIDESDFACVMATFETEDSLKRCIPIPGRNIALSISMKAVISLTCSLLVSIVVNMTLMFVVRNYRQITRMSKLTFRANNAATEIEELYEACVDDKETNLYLALSNPSSGTQQKAKKSQLKRKKGKVDQRLSPRKAKSNHGFPSTEVEVDSSYGNVDLKN